jgi:hypothetical protein
VAGDDRQRGHTGTSTFQVPSSGSTMRCEDETVDWVESDSWLMRIVDNLKLLARNSYRETNKCVGFGKN